MMVIMIMVMMVLAKLSKYRQSKGAEIKIAYASRSNTKSYSKTRSQIDEKSTIVRNQRFLCVGVAFCIQRAQNEAEMRAKATKMEPNTSRRQPKGRPKGAKSRPKCIRKTMFGKGQKKVPGPPSPGHLFSGPFRKHFLI